MRVTILGCGASTGVPLIGCKCEVCTSENPKNKRLRSSVFVETGKAKILFDTAPDFRQQAITNNINELDAVFYTHAHADHINGLDDLRSFNILTNKPMKAYSDAKTLDEIKKRYDYAFHPPKPEFGWYRPSLEAIEIGFEEVDVNGEKIQPFLQEHGRITSLGFRIGDFAYSTDVTGFSEEAFAALDGIKAWVVDCQGYKKPPTHSYLEQTLKWIERVKPEIAVLTHMSHEFEYEKLKNELPQGVVPGYDGMIIGK